MVLKELLRGINFELIQGTLDADVKEINYDSRKVSPESIFICIEGFKSDGHKFIDGAVKNGAAAIFVQRDVEVENYDIAVLKVEDTRKVLALLAAAFYGEPSKEFNLIGVTGTNGKTSTTYMIKSVLEALGQKTGIIGTIANMIGEEKIHTERTTPESLELQQLFRRMADEKVDAAAMEVSSHALSLSRVYGCKFKVGIFTNLTRDHLDFHKTFEEYAKAKSMLFQMSDTAVINIDDVYCEYMLKGAKGKILTFGINKDGDITAKNIENSASGVKYLVSTPVGEAEINISTPGLFTVYNSLGCIGACLSIGISLQDIKNGLEAMKCVTGRFELVKSEELNKKNISVIVDYAHTPDGLENILNTAREFAKGKIITVFGCGGDRDRTKRPIMGEVCAKLSDFCIVTSDNPRTEDPQFIISEIIPGIEKIKTAYLSIVDRKSAIEEALNIATNDDIVIIAGKGHEDYQDIMGIKTHFDDKEIVLEIFQKKAERENI